MNQQPFSVPPHWWAPRLRPFWVNLLRGHRLRVLRQQQRITQIEVRGLDLVAESLRQNSGLLITPNHSFHYDSYVLFEAAARLNRPFHFLAAWQVFAMSSSWDRWLLQSHGAFSIDREGTDLRAFKASVEILKSSPHPLVVFPEGDIYHTNDRLTPFREGAAAIAISAAKRAERPVYAVPAALKCWYVEDPTPRLVQVLELLEKRFNWRPRSDLPLRDRIYRLAEGILALKELEYLGEARRGGLPARLQSLSETILTGMERQAGLKVRPGTIVPERVKELRRHHIGLLQQPQLPADERIRLENEMEDLFFVVQLYSYPGDYAMTTSTVERLAEIIDKLEEDVLGLAYPSVKGERRVVLEFGKPVDVGPFVSQPEGSQQLTRLLQSSVQGQLDQLNGVVAPPVIDALPLNPAALC